MEKLIGKKIVIAGSRKTEEMSVLIEKQGGTPLVRPLQGLLYFDESVIQNELLFCVQQHVDWFIFTTGIGTETLLEGADRLGIRADLIDVIQAANVAARGYKTYAFLKKLNIKPDVVDEDGTTHGLFNGFASIDLKGKQVVVQLHGELQPELVHFLEDRGAQVIQLLPYRHIEPETTVLETLSLELITGEVDAVCFTTAVQVRYLFDYARRTGEVERILQAFSNRARAVAIGKVTAEALRKEGVARMVVPETERMGAMIIELVKHYEELSS
ncbi:uroporphyrinogen-III synthase [Paenibacillus sp. N3.4]|uniref:uroporphyrinogen-III synthase n=1 Tax=Paenibacillus sp. N3.4 TaxID=2603222 RepID=UPI0011C7D10A|nr:uroporphyrinogen-III synthase [Paenibacillus sp. N3.4]TXK76958.1 uroporphyrinogen-III synthase [Paenibacillus sp. N3.4]